MKILTKNYIKTAVLLQIKMTLLNYKISVHQTLNICLISEHEHTQPKLLEKE